MKKKTAKMIGTLTLLVLVAVSCRVQAPASIKITPDNFLDLETSSEGSVTQPEGFIWASDSQSLLVLTANGISSLDAFTLESKETFSLDYQIFSSQISPDGKTIAIPKDEQSISLLDLGSLNERLAISTGSYLNSFSFSPDGKKLLTTSYDELVAEVWDAESGNKIQSFSGFDTAAPVYNASFAENSRHIIWNSRGRIQVTDVESGQLSMPFDHEDFVTSWALSTDGQFLATSSAATVQGHFAPSVLIWNTSTAETRMLMNSDEPYDGLTFCPDSHLVAVLEEKVITIIDLDQFNKPAELFMPGSPVASMAFSPDGTALAAINMDGDISIWRIPPEN